MKIRIYKMNGKIEEKTIEKEDNLLSVLQEAVGGYIEKVPAIGGREIYCNEEGRIWRLPLNPHFQGIVGNVVEIIKGEK